MFGSYISVLDSLDYYKFQDDIWLSKKEVDSLQNLNSTRGVAIINRTWPDNKIYYMVEGIPNEYKAYISKAILKIEERTYLDFVQGKGDKGYIQFNYVASNDWDAHSDYLGMKKGKQNIVLSTDAIKSVGTIIHEICHAIGMDHEQNRSDRDNYLTIDFLAMKRDFKEKYKEKKISV